MRVSRNTPSQLILSEMPWAMAIATLFFTLTFLAIAIFLVSEGVWVGLIFLVGVALGYGAMAVFVERLQVIFHGPENYVEIRRRALHSNFRVRHDLSEIRDAVLQERQGENQIMRRAALRIGKGQSKGTHPITEIYSSGAGAIRTVDAINSWLRNWHDAGEGP